jgi:hypothetical protein
MTAAPFVKPEPTEPDPWPDLIPLDAPSLPRLDVSLLPGWAGAFARELAADTETPPELASGMVLATAATAVARAVRLCVRSGYFEPLNLWVAAALTPGNRKSRVQRAAAAPLLAWEADQARELEPEIKRAKSEVATIQERVKRLRTQAAKGDGAAADEAAELEADMPLVPAPPQLWTSDATPERLGALLAENDESMAWLSSEGGIFDLLAGRYSSGIPNLDLVLKAWSGDAERVDRGGRPPVFLREPLLSIGLSPQPDLLRGLATRPGFRGRGLLGRFLFLLPPSPLGFRTLEARPMGATTEAAYGAGVGAMLNWPLATDDEGRARRHVIRLSREARGIWLEFAKFMESTMRPGGDFEHATDWAGKAPGQAARLAGVLHCIEHAHGQPWEVELSPGTMAAALDLAAVFARHSLAALDLMGADPSIAAARKVWAWVEAGRRERFTVRECYKALQGSFPRVAMVREALEALEERAYLAVTVPEASAQGGRPSPFVTVRPDIAAGWL